MWFEKATVYQIYPLGLCGAPADNDGVTAPRILRLLDWVEHIKRTGADTVLLNPVFDSDRHGYDTRDYTRVDPRLGTNGDLAQVCRAFHDAGLRVMLDGVFNHVGRGFWAFRDVQEKKWDSPYKDWFHIDFNGNTDRNDGFWYECWEGHSELVKLNLHNPAVVEHQFQDIRGWAEQFGNDGLRLLPLERGGTERLQGEALALWEMERQSILESALEALGRQEEAHVLCENALAAFDPCAVLAAAEARRFQEIAIMLWNAAGRLRMALGDSDGAITAWRNCINMAPVRGTEYYSLDSVKRLIKCMLRRGDLDEAERYNNILSAMLPEEGMAAFNAVKIAFERKRQHRQTTDPVGSE